MTLVLGRGVTVGILTLGIAVLVATLLISVLWGLATWAGRPLDRPGKGFVSTARKAISEPDSANTVCGPVPSCA